MHAAKIIHRDLKPENIVLARSGVWTIIDLGSATVCKTNMKIYSYAQSRFYRAPEVALHDQYSFKIDIWSLGCIIAELITKIPLFEARSEIELVGKHTSFKVESVFAKWSSESFWFLRNVSKE